MCSDTDREIRKEAKRIVTQYKGVFTSPPVKVPTDFVVDGPILGNGDIGVVISGQPEMQRLWISKCDFWKSKPEGGGVRPLGGIDICIDELKDASYLVEQRLYEAEVVSNFRTHESTVFMKSWVTASQNLLVIELYCEGKPVKVEVNLWVKTGNESETESQKSGNIWWATRKFNNPSLEWPTEGIIAACCLEENLEGFTLHPGQKVIIAAAVGTNHNGASYLEDACRIVENITPQSLQEIRLEHTEWWSDFWSKSLIELGDPLLEKFWYGSHYIMASCSRNRSFPPGLFGNWITTDTPGWFGDYHLNYNHQAPWWGVYSSNRVELSEAYDTPILQFLNKGKENAKTYLNCRGVYYDVGIGPKGFNTSAMKNSIEDNHLFLGQKSNASYAAVNMLMRFYHTYDMEYARNIAYPFLVEVADFWEDYLRFEDGRYVIYKDAIHEVPVYKGENFTEDDKKLFEDMNPILSLGLVRAVFKGILDMSTEMNVDAERRNKWKYILEHMSDFPVQEREGKKVFRYTEKGMDWWKDNTLGIQHVWPAGTIGLSSGPELLNIARNTISVMNRWTDFNGFPTIFTAAARVGYDPQIILDNLRHQCRQHSFPNLFIFFGGGGIECCSAVPSCINEMLMQSHEGVIRLFPVWPEDMSAKFKNLRAVGAFLVTSEFQDGKVKSIEITSEKGRTCIIKNPWHDVEPVVYQIGETDRKPVEFEMNESGLSFGTNAGDTYIIEHK